MSTAESVQTAAPPTAASAGFDQVRMYGTWPGSGVVNQRQRRFPVFASRASMCPRIGASPLFGPAKTMPFLPIGAKVVAGLVRLVCPANTPTPETCAVQTTEPVFAFSAATEPSSWPAKIIPLPKVSVREDARNDVLSPFGGAGPR